MIVFHEGLPGAGKSYEACLMHILPALEAGRTVVTNIEGINHEKFSEHTNIPVPVLQKMLITIDHPHDPDAQKDELLEKTVKDCLVVIDEIQNLFPPGRQRLSDAWNKYVSEHRHEGLDIILMGQDKRDLHAIWRRRIQRLIVFTNQGPVGRPGHYKWEAYEAQTPEKYQKISSGSRAYEKIYFGLYSSYTEGTAHKKVYEDKRVSIFSGKGFTLGIPVFLVVLVWAISYLVDFFSPPDPVAKPVITRSVETKVTTSSVKAEAVSSTVKTENTEPVPDPPIDVFDQLAKQYKPRLAGVIQGSFNGVEKLLATVQLIDPSMHVKDEFDLTELVDLGWSYQYRTSGLELKKQNVRYLIRAWPVESWGRVDHGTRESLRDAPSAASATPQAFANSPKIVYLDSPQTSVDFSVPRSYGTGVVQR